MEFSDKFVAFVDILGFKGMVGAAEAGDGDMSLSRILSLCEVLARESDVGAIRQHGPHLCPQSPRLRPDLDFRVTQVSDCVVVSAEVSPAGVIHIIEHCWSVALGLLKEGVLVRGYITRGSVHHDGHRLVGSAYQHAYAKESGKGPEGIRAFSRGADDPGTPFIELDPAVSAYVAAEGDECVKEMFTRFIESDGIVDAIFPFKRLAHSFGGGAGVEPEREKHFNDVMRGWIHTMRERVAAGIQGAKPEVIKKGQHYLAFLDHQLDVCDNMDRLIDSLLESYPRLQAPMLSQQIVGQLAKLNSRLRSIEGLHLFGCMILPNRTLVTVTEDPSASAVDAVRFVVQELGLPGLVIELRVPDEQ